MTMIIEGMHVVYEGERRRQYRLKYPQILQPHGLKSTKLLCPWDSPSKNTGVGCHFFLQRNLTDPGIEPTSLVFPALAGRFFTASAAWGSLTDQSSNASSVASAVYSYVSYLASLSPSILGRKTE